MLLRFILLTTFVVASAHGETLRVLDEDGSPIANASVIVDGVRVTLDAEGHFNMPASAGSPARVDVSADGYYRFTHAIARQDLIEGHIRPITLVEKKPGRRLLLFAGDAMMTRRYLVPRAGEPKLVSLDNLAEDARKLLDPIRPYIGLADYASVNLETTLSDVPPGEPLPKSVNFWSHPELARALKDAGFDYMALGNNHTYDYRDAGVVSTLDALDELDVGYSGVGVNEQQARKPWDADVFGESFAFLSYVGWPGNFEPSQAADGDKGGAALGTVESFSEDIRAIPPMVPAIVQHHSGLEYADHPPLSVQTELHHAIDSGADLAIAHHPHVTQGLELYRDRLIAYSLGNFLFDQFFYSTQVGKLLYVWMDGSNFHRAEVVPLHISGYVPTPATGSIRYAALHRLARQSARFGTCFAGSGAHAVIDRNAACEPTPMALPANGGSVVTLRKLGLSPLRPHFADRITGRYRLGTDILRRGYFDYSGLYGTRDRGWLMGRNDNIEDSWKIRILPGEGTARVGMKVFDRAFTPSTPTTLSGRIRARGNAKVTVYLQRRTTRQTMTEALDEGPMKKIGEIPRVSSGFADFRFHFDQPRVNTRSVRLLFDIEDSDGKGVAVEIDDMSWVEWQTSWLHPDEGAANARYATHLERE